MSNPTELPDLDRVHLLHSQEQDILLMANHHARGEDDGNYDFEAGGLLELVSRAIAQYGHLARRAQPEGEAPQAEVVGEVKRDRATGMPYIDWKRDHTLLPVGFKLYAAAQHAESGAQAANVLSTLPGCLEDRLYEAIGIARHRAAHAGSSARIKKWDATAVDLRAALTAQSQGAPVNSVALNLEAQLRAVVRERDDLRGKLDAVWQGVRDAVAKYSGRPCEGEPFDRLDELLAAQQAAALGLLDAYEMTRLRRLMKALGQEDAFERDDEHVRGSLCTVLGIAAGRVERATGTPEAPAEPTKAMLGAMISAADHLDVAMNKSEARAIYLAAQRAAQLDGGQGEGAPVDCSGAPSSCPDNEGFGCHCSTKDGSEQNG